MPNTVLSCECGCGGVGVRYPYGVFANGHWQRLRARLVEAARGGDNTALLELGRRGWTRFLTVVNTWHVAVPRVGGRFVRRDAAAPALAAAERPVVEVAATTARVRRAAEVDQRRFGVELEFFGVSPDAVMAGLVAAGLEAEFCEGRGASRKWRVKRDYTPNPQPIWELSSPPLKGAAGFDALKKALKALRDVGARTNIRTGLHVHHEARDLTVEHVFKLVSNYESNRSNIEKVLSRSRNGQVNRYCGRWSSSDLQSLGRLVATNGIRELTMVGGKYKTVNVTVLPAYGTVEFRQHQGTLAYKKVEAWVKFGQAMIAKAKTSAVMAAIGGVREFFEAVTPALTEFFVARAQALGNGAEAVRDAAALAAEVVDGRILPRDGDAASRARMLAERLARVSTAEVA